MHALTPPSADEAFQRLWALTITVRVALGLRPPSEIRAALAGLPRAAREAMTRDAAGQMAAFRGELESAGAWGHLTERERAFLLTPPHDLADAEWMLATVRLEALAALSWALGYAAEFPPFDAGPAPALLDALATSTHVPALRPREEMERMRTAAELWHWRSRTRAFRDGVWPLPAGVTHEQLDRAVREAAEKAAADGLIAAPVEGDFPARGKAYRRLGDAEWRQVNTTTVQRHHALNWLCGRAPGNDWEAT